MNKPIIKVKSSRLKNIADRCRDPEILKAGVRYSNTLVSPGAEQARIRAAQPPDGIPCAMIVLEQSGNIAETHVCQSVRKAVEYCGKLVKDRRDTEVFLEGVTTPAGPYAEFILVCGTGVVVRLDGTGAWESRKIV